MTRSLTHLVFNLQYGQLSGAYDLVNAGVSLDDVNVGTLSRDNASKTVTHQISVTQDDIDDFKELDQKGVHLFAQLNPSVKGEDFMKLLQA